MGEILLTTLGDALGGAVPVNASVTAVASRVRTDGAEVTAPATVRVHIRDGVPDARFVLDASGADWYWTLTIRFVNIARSVVRHVAVPEGVVEWGDLVEVDPATYQPVDPTPTLLDTINAQVAAYLIENPAASPEQIEQAVTAWLSENPVEGVTQAELDAAVAGLARSADLAEVATSGAYADLDGLPVLDFAPTAHTHAQSDVDGLTAALASKVGTDDPRLSDARTPVAHTHEIGDVTGLEDALANAGGGGGGVSTGWQDVSALLTSGASGTAYVMREGKRVTWRFQITPAAAAAAAAAFITVPAGFEDDGPIGNVVHPVPGLSNIYAGRVYQAAGQLWIQAGTAALRFQYEYNTTVPMP